MSVFMFDRPGEEEGEEEEGGAEAGWGGARAMCAWPSVV